jgi:hypothetical protein
MALLKLKIFSPKKPLPEETTILEILFEAHRLILKNLSKGKKPTIKNRLKMNLS